MNTFHSILEAIHTYAEQTPDALCLADENGDMSYRVFERKINGLADFLLKAGIQPGERVVASARQKTAYLVLCHAVQLMGAIFVPLEKTANSERIEEVVAQTKAALYVGEKEISGCRTLSYAQLPDCEAANAPCALPQETADSMILFTTGTTGKSKGILLTHRSEITVAENVKYGVEMKPENVEIIPMPMNHSFGLRRYFANIINGSAVVLLDGVVFIARLFQMMERYHATALAMAPSALSVIFRLSGDRLGDFRHQLDYIQFGSAPIPESSQKHLLALLPDCRLYNIYGTTESGCSCVLNFNSADRKPACIGRPARHARFITADETGRQVLSDPAHPALLGCAGEMNMKGYYHDEALTASIMKNGYIFSNDLGAVDADGLVYLYGRADDVINCGGNKIAPTEIEEAANTFADVLECACIAEPDKLLGEVPKLFVVPGAAYREQALYAYLTQRLEKYKLPRNIETIKQLPRTYNGKIWRKKLAEKEPDSHF